MFPPLSPLFFLKSSHGFTLLPLAFPRLKFPMFPAFFVLFICLFYGCVRVFPCQIVVCLCSPLFHPVCKPVPVSFFSFPSVAFVAPHPFALFSSTLPGFPRPGQSSALLSVLQPTWPLLFHVALAFPLLFLLFSSGLPQILHTKKPQSVSALRPFALIFLILPRNPEFLSSRLCPYEQIPSQRRLPPATLRR